MNIEKCLNWAAIIVVPVILFALAPRWNARFADSKELRYWISHESVVNDQAFGYSATEWPEVLVTYKGRSVHDARFVSVTFCNVGKVPIKTADFEGVILFLTDTPGRIMEYRISDRTPSGLDPKLRIVKEGLELQPLLLNPGDGFTVDLFGSGKFSVVRVDSRIVGIDKIAEDVQEKYFGLRVERIDSDTNFKSTHEAVFALPPYLIAVASTISLIMSMLASRLRDIAIRGYAKVLVIILCLGVYAIGLFFAALFPHALYSNDRPNWQNVLLYLIITGIPLVIGIRLRTLFRSTPAPNFPNQAILPGPGH